MSSTILTRRCPPFLSTLLQPATKSRYLSTSLPRSAGWEGRKGDEHVTNRDHELDVQSSASKSGARQRAGEGPTSSAANEKDIGNQNAKAKKDHPEAPEPVIGMNDERGRVSEYHLA